MASSNSDFNSDENTKCVLEATVVTGFEVIAKEECVEKLGVNAKSERGRIFIEIDADRAHEALKLRGVDNVLVVIKDFPCFNISSNKEEAFAQFKKLPAQVDWMGSLKVWRNLTKFEMPIEQITRYMGLAQENNQESAETSKDGPLASEDDSTLKEDSKEVLASPKSSDCKVVMPRFRVTCNRSGKKHCFSSQEVACHFGGAVQDYFQWQADMKKHDIHVVLTVNEQRVYLCLVVTKESLHNRNLEHFGPTSLRSTIAHNMLRLCGIRSGDIVCDPMCGGGSLPIEGSLSWKKSYFICGDNHDMAWARTLQNLEALNINAQEPGFRPAIDVQKWDARNLPLRDNSVDIVVTDLPFGKRMGSRTDNRSLYPQVLREMARVCRIGKGRAVLLTQDRQSLTKAVLSQNSLWWQKRVLAVNIGGLAASVYVLQRTNKPQPKVPWPPQVASHTTIPVNSDPVPVGAE